MDGAQRQLKVLGIFARLNYRDGKAQYLDDMPRVMAYLRRTCERYIELKPLLLLLDELENRQEQVGYTFDSPDHGNDETLPRKGEGRREKGGGRSGSALPS